MRFLGAPRAAAGLASLNDPATELSAAARCQASSAAVAAMDPLRNVMSTLHAKSELLTANSLATAACRIKLSELDRRPTHLCVIQRRLGYG